MRIIRVALLMMISETAFGAIQEYSLKQVLDLANKQNLDLVSANQSFELDTIIYNNAWRTFFLPSVNLSTNSTSGLTLGNYPGTPASANPVGASGRRTGYPLSSVTLAVGSYTLFNFFKDRINYDNARLSFERAHQSLEENRRSINFRIIAAYFQARLNQEKLDAAERSLQIAKTIVRLVRSRVAIGQAPADELSSVEVDANEASLQVNTLKSDYESSLLSLNALLNQSSETQIRLSTPLNYHPMKLNYNQAYAWFKDHAPGIRGSKLAQQLAQGNLEIAEKNRMPLPTISFSGLTVTYGNTYVGGTNSYQGASSSAGNGTLELQAAVSLTLPILGPGGFLGEDNARSARINVNQAEIRLQQTMINGDLQIRAVVFQLQQLESRLKTQKENFESSAKLLEKIISNISTQKANRLELRDALERARNNEIDLLQNTYGYIIQKIQFYESIGKDWEDE
jgi:outer membrane protein TolC